jgi:hypothetical protein
MRRKIDGDSYRLKEAKERQLQRSSSRRPKKPSPDFTVFPCFLMPGNKQCGALGEALLCEARGVL